MAISLANEATRQHGVDELQKAARSVCQPVEVEPTTLAAGLRTIFSLAGWDIRLTKEVAEQVGVTTRELFRLTGLRQPGKMDSVGVWEDDFANNYAFICPAETVFGIAESVRPIVHGRLASLKGHTHLTCSISGKHEVYCRNVADLAEVSWILETVSLSAQDKGFTWLTATYQPSLTWKYDSLGSYEQLQIFDASRPTPEKCLELMGIGPQVVEGKAWGSFPILEGG